MMATQANVFYQVVKAIVTGEGFSHLFLTMRTHENISPKMFLPRASKHVFNILLQYHCIPLAI